MRDVALDTVAPESVEVAREALSNLKPRVLRLGRQERKKRIVETLKALGRLRHGANLTRNLSDVAPVVILLACLDGGNAPFQNLFTDEETGVALNLLRLGSVLKDYKDRLLGERKLYFGFRPGVLANEEQIQNAFKNKFEGVTVFVGTPGEAISEATKLFDSEGLL
jgi:CRISPR/Cas system-associated protein Cas7 (RAMP superfamily)